MSAFSSESRPASAEWATRPSIYEQTPANEIAVASGLLRTSGYIGAIFASSAIALTFGNTATDAGLHTIAYIFGAAGLIVTALALFDRAIPWKANRDPQEKEQS